MGCVICNSCKCDIPKGEFCTEINPEGGFGRPRFVVCDACLPEYTRPSVKDMLERHVPKDEKDAAAVKKALAAYSPEKWAQSDW